MATTSRRRSSHGLTSSGSSTQLARRGSSSRSGAARGRFDPSFMMSSNAQAGADNGDKPPSQGQVATADRHEPRRKSVEDAKAYEKMVRRNKSTDRLQRSGGSSTNLSAKRSKSYTHLATTSDDGRGKRRKASSKRDPSEELDKRESEDGWTSASADNTSSSSSADASPSSSQADDGLVLGIKKRPPPELRVDSNYPTLAAPIKEALAHPPDTPKASAQRLGDDLDVVGTLSAAPTSATNRVAPPSLAREDTSKTLTNDEDKNVGRASDDQMRGQSEVSKEGGDISTLNRALSTLDLGPNRASTTSLDHENEGGSSELGLDARKHPQARHHRAPSNASNRTLRSSVPMASSPASIRSRSSNLSSRFLLYPRESQAAAPPMLDTHNALAGRLGARHEDRGDPFAPLQGPNRHFRSVSAMTSSNSAPVGFDQNQIGGGSLASRRKPSTNSMTGTSISVSSSSASIANLSHPATARMQHSSLLNPSDNVNIGGFPSDRRRTSSTQSLTAADAAKLAAKLRLARDSMDDPTSSGYTPAQRGGYNPRLEKYKKPVISTFAKDDSSEMPQAIEVKDSSVYSRFFAQAHDSKEGQVRGRRMIRYVMGYGISGPPIEKSELSDALLGPSLDMDDFESSWAPALANAAGLGARIGHHPMRSIETEYGIVAPDATTAAGGPNATPLHLIHGLTTTSPDPFPLDPTDVPALQAEVDLFDPHPVTKMGQPPIQFVDPGLIRAIAITTHAISTHRMHVVTRRYADPMREGLERVARSSGRYGALPKAPPNSVPASPQVTSTARWGRKTAPNSPIGSRSDLRDSRPGYQRRNTSDTGNQSTTPSSNLAGQLYHLVDAAEHPVRSLKRVWSGGLSRGGLAALTRTEEEP